MSVAEAEPKLRALRLEWRRFGVRRAWLFGSRAGRRENPSSDWDFIVEFSSPPGFDRFMGLKLFLEQRLNGRVDVLSRSACAPRLWSKIELDLVDVT